VFSDCMLPFWLAQIAAACGITPVDPAWRTQLLPQVKLQAYSMPLLLLSACRLLPAQTLPMLYSCELLC
jgi:hypothetical protein